MVVPVLVAFGSGTPWAWRAALRLWLEKSKPPMVVVCVWDLCIRGSGDGVELASRRIELRKAGEVVETGAAMEVA
jgi:hypothetical protein